MGRLENIAERNKKPAWWKGQISFGLRSLFLLVILGLLIFTDWALSPEDDRPGINIIPPPPDETRVEGIRLRRAPAPPRDAGPDQGVRP
jgi:hypothetical protein